MHGAPTITVFYIYSKARAAKVKRIRNNPNVALHRARCAEMSAASGSMAAPASVKMTSARGQHLLTQKYGLLKIVGDFFSRLMRHKQTVIVVGTDGRDQPATPMTRIDGLRLFRN